MPLALGSISSQPEFLSASECASMRRMSPRIRPLRNRSNNNRRRHRGAGV